MEEYVSEDSAGEDSEPLPPLTPSLDACHASVHMLVSKLQDIEKKVKAHEILMTWYGKPRATLRGVASIEDKVESSLLTLSIAGRYVNEMPVYEFLRMILGQFV